MLILTKNIFKTDMDVKFISVDSEKEMAEYESLAIVNTVYWPNYKYVSQQS